mmetsp:Transcript_3538/g.9041  ORF Transcript_3538/g.9041 Transcript_3538/m.9041 type:complete len:121 (-) Transcript_3538:1401-1763(-)
MHTKNSIILQTKCRRINGICVNEFNCITQELAETRDTLSPDTLGTTTNLVTIPHADCLPQLVSRLTVTAVDAILPTTIPQADYRRFQDSIILRAPLPFFLQISNRISSDQCFVVTFMEFL